MEWVVVAGAAENEKNSLRSCIIGMELFCVVFSLLLSLFLLVLLYVHMFIFCLSVYYSRVFDIVLFTFFLLVNGDLDDSASWQSSVLTTTSVFVLLVSYGALFIL